MASTKILTKVQAVLNAKSLGLDAATTLAIQNATANLIEAELATAKTAISATQGSKTPATLAFTLNGSVVSATAVAGTGFTSRPTITVDNSGTNGSGATATTTLKLLSVAINAAGSKYYKNQVLQVTGGTGTKATVKITAITATGGISAVSVLSAGSYTALPTLTGCTLTKLVTGQPGTSGTLNLTFGLNTVDVTAGGSGYTAAPVFTVTGGGGSGATSAATIAGPIATVTASPAGTGYVTVPSVYITSATGTGFSVTTTLSTGALVTPLVTSFVAGTGYRLTDTIGVIGGFPSHEIDKLTTDF